MNVGTDRSPTERFFSVPFLVLERHENRGFYRSEAHFVVFIVTDTEDHSAMGPKQVFLVPRVIFLISVSLIMVKNWFISQIV